MADQANVAAGEIPGFWWGCEPEQLETEQIQHTGGTAYGYGDPNAYMIFNVADTVKAEAAMRGRGYTSVSQEDISVI